MKLLKNKNLQLGLALIILVFTTTGATYLYLTGDQVPKNISVVSGGSSNKTKSSTNSDTSSSSSKQSAPKNNTETSQQTTGQNQAPAVDNLSDVSLHAVLNTVDQSISLTLMGNSGIYTVERCTNYENVSDCSAKGPWVTAQANATIANANGVSLGGETIPVYETERIYRVYRIVAGSKVGPKEILIDRNLVVSKDGVTNFPGVL